MQELRAGSSFDELMFELPPKPHRFGDFVTNATSPPAAGRVVADFGTAAATGRQSGFPAALSEP